MKSHMLLISILVIALLIRVIGLVPGHNYYHPDEPMSYGSATDMLVFGDLNPRRFDYPAGVPLLHYGVYKTFFLPFIFAKMFVPHPRVLLAALNIGQHFFEQFRVQIFGLRDLHALYWSRFTTALLGTLSVLLTYLIAEKLGSPFAGLVASIFVAFNYRHVLSSHLALSDIPNNFFALLSFYYSILLLEKNSWRRYMLAAITVSLSLSMKYQMLALVPFVFAHVVWAVRRRNFAELINKKIVVSAVVIAGVFLLLNLYLPFNWEKVRAIIRVVYLRYGAGANRFNFYPLYYLYYWGIGRLPSIAIILGFFLSLVRFPFQTITLLTYVAPFLYVFLYYMTGGTYIRNFTSVIPFLAIFAGMGFFTIYTYVKKYMKSTLALLLLGLLVLIINFNPLKDSLVLSFAYSTPWVRDRLTEWAFSHIPDNATIINDNTSIPSDPTKPLNLIPWSRDEPNSVTEFMKRDIDFAVLNLNWNPAYFYWLGFPTRELLKLRGGLPAMSRDDYHGLFLSEYLRYGVYAAYRPWQAPDDAYLVIKIPKMPRSLGREIWSAHFSGGLEGWKYYDFNPIATNGDLIWNSIVGNWRRGSLELTGKGARVSLTRVISPFIPIIPDHVYTIEGYLMTDEVRQSSQKDGFLRVDFYGSPDMNLLGVGGLVKAVSETLYGKAEWTKKQVIVAAPADGRFLTVSMQRSLPGVSGHYWVDDIVVFESSEKLGERLPSIPYIYPTIPDDIVYPNSIY